VSTTLSTDTSTPCCPCHCCYWLIIRPSQTSARGYAHVAATAMPHQNAQLYVNLRPTQLLTLSLPTLSPCVPGARKRGHAALGVHHALIRTSIRHSVRVLRDSRTTAAAATAAAAFRAAACCRRQQQRPSSSTSSRGVRQQRQQQQCSSDTCRWQDAEWICFRTCCVWIEFDAAAALVRPGSWGRGAAAVAKHAH
jgi:hypothetical protein